MVATTLSETVRDPLELTVSDVTGMRRLTVTTDGYRTAQDVATSIAQRLELPAETPYSFRDDRHARMLLDDVEIGRQVGDLDQAVVLVIIPKAHLG